MKKIKVMHLLKSNQFAGAENVAITIINTLKQDVDSIYVSPDGPVKCSLKEHGVDYKPIRKVEFSEIKRVIFENTPDIIHAHDYTAGIICSMATRLPIINHLHHNPLWIKSYNMKSISYAFSSLRYKKILVVSESILDEYVFRNIIKSKTRIIGNPIDLKKIRELAGYDNEKKYDIAFLGRIARPKNPHMFIDIIKRIRIYLPNVSAIMIGDGEMRDEIEKRIMNEKLGDSISLVGFQSNPYILLQQASILCMPSLWEGYGLAAVEALALGIPVICSNAGGLPDLVNNECGYVCNELEQYVYQILRMLSDKAHYNMVSMKAKKRAEGIANMEMYRDNMIRIYKQVLEK